MDRSNPDIAEYKRLRAISQRLATKLTDRIATESLHACAAELDMLSRGTLVFSSENDMAILFDFCIYQHRLNGKTVVERFAEETPPDPHSDEMRVLRANLAAYYSIFEIAGAERGAGVYVNDLLRGETRFLNDIGFGNTAQPGVIMATRVVPYPGVLMTTGAALPMTPQQFAAIKIDLQKLIDLGSGKITELSPEQETALATMVIRKALRLGYSSQVAYAEAGTPAPVGRAIPSAPRATSQRAGRNDPCPCGSGRKFKVCCGRA